MLTGSHQGRRVGACTDCRSYWKDYRAGLIDVEEIWRVNDALVPTVGVSAADIHAAVRGFLNGLWVDWTDVRRHG